MDDIIVTVFTPTYNRAYILEKLYESLINQTSFAFEWMIVDDGSTDNTEKLVKKWTNPPFKLSYYKKKNGGKHRAINYGLKQAVGKLFFIVDSDDFLNETAIEKIIQWESQLPKDRKYAGVSGNRGYYQNSRIVGSTFSGQYLDCSYMDRDKYNIEGDKAEAYYTDILRKYKFPEIEGENFITERVVWDKIAEDGYILRYYNEIIYLSEYLEDGLTKNGDDIYKRNPIGVAYNLKQMIRIYKYPLIKKYKEYYSYYLMVSDIMTKKEISKMLSISSLKLNLIVLMGTIKNVLWRFVR